MSATKAVNNPELFESFGGGNPGYDTVSAEPATFLLIDEVSENEAVTEVIPNNLENYFGQLFEVSHGVTESVDETTEASIDESASVDITEEYIYNGNELTKQNAYNKSQAIEANSHQIPIVAYSIPDSETSKDTVEKVTDSISPNMHSHENKKINESALEPSVIRYTWQDVSESNQDNRPKRKIDINNPNLIQQQESTVNNENLNKKPLNMEYQAAEELYNEKLQAKIYVPSLVKETTIIPAVEPVGITVDLSTEAMTQQIMASLEESELESDEDIVSLNVDFLDSRTQQISISGFQKYSLAPHDIEEEAEGMKINGADTDSNAPEVLSINNVTQLFDTVTDRNDSIYETLANTAEVHLGTLPGNVSTKVIAEREVTENVNKLNEPETTAMVTKFDEEAVRTEVLNNITDKSKKEEILSTIKNLVEETTMFTLSEDNLNSLSSKETLIKTELKAKNPRLSGKNQYKKESNKLPVYYETIDIKDETYTIQEETTMQDKTNLLVLDEEFTTDEEMKINEDVKIDDEVPIREGVPTDVEVTTVRRLPATYPGASSPTPPPAEQPQIINHNMNLQTALIINTLSKVGEEKYGDDVTFILFTGSTQRTTIKIEEPTKARKCKIRIL